jgi:hypothetical protein
MWGAPSDAALSIAHPAPTTKVLPEVRLSLPTCHERVSSWPQAPVTLPNVPMLVSFATAKGSPSGKDRRKQHQRHHAGPDSAPLASLGEQTEWTVMAFRRLYLAVPSDTRSTSVACEWSWRC